MVLASHSLPADDGVGVGVTDGVGTKAERKSDKLLVSNTHFTNDSSLSYVTMNDKQTQHY